jgi:molecular chaperone GrpE (heat shock protein)
MTCYFRHLKGIFQKAGVEVTSENKKELDRTIHEIVAVRYKNCPQTWKEVKKRIAEDEEGFVAALRTAWKKSV